MVLPAVRLIILEGSTMIADIANYTGRVPAVGEYIAHPRHLHNVIGQVKTITNVILDTHVSSLEVDNPVYDTACGNPIVEVSV